MSSVIEKSIEVDVPLSTAYNQWTQFEEFPQFMEGVEEVKQLDDRRLHWRADIAGADREFDAEITEQRPDEVIAWRAMGDTGHEGRVMFRPIDPNKTEVSVRMQYEPEGFVENVGDALGILDARVKGDLKRFKGLIEERGVESGGYRGEHH